MRTPFDFATAEGYNATPGLAGLALSGENAHMLTCPNGHPVALGDLFCHQCGATVKPQTDETAVRSAPSGDETAEQTTPDRTVLRPEPAIPPLPMPAEPPPPGGGFQPPPFQPPPYEPPTQRRDSSTMIYAIAGLVVLLAIVAVGVVLLVSGSGGSNQPAKNPLTNPTISSTPGGAAPASGSITVSDGCGDAPMSQPTQFNLQCDGSASLSNLTWSSWGTSQTALGSGTYNTPQTGAQAAGSVPVNVEMYQVVSGSTGQEFSTITVTPPTGPAITWSQSTPDGTWAITSSQTKGPMPAGGKLCPSLIKGKYQYGTFGSNTSCGFVRAVYNAWEASGNQSPVSATSPATHETYHNIVCTVDATASWATCVGGRNNSAHMFFALP